MTNIERLLEEFDALEYIHDGSYFWTAKLKNIYNGPISRQEPEICIGNFDDLCTAFGYDTAKNIIINYISGASTYYSEHENNINSQITQYFKYEHIVYMGDVFEDKVVFKGFEQVDTFRTPGLGGINNALGIFTYERLSYLLFNSHIKIFEQYILIDDPSINAYSIFATNDNSIISSAKIEVPVLDYNVSFVKAQFPLESTRFDDVPGLYFICNILCSVLKTKQSENKVFSKGVLNNITIKNKIYQELDEKLVDLYNQTNICKSNAIFNDGRFPIKMGILDNVEKDMTLAEYEAFVFKNWQNNKNFEYF